MNERAGNHIQFQFFPFLTAQQQSTCSVGSQAKSASTHVLFFPGQMTGMLSATGVQSNPVQVFRLFILCEQGRFKSIDPSEFIWQIRQFCRPVLPAGYIATVLSQFCQFRNPPFLSSLDSAADFSSTNPLPHSHFLDTV